MMRNNRAMTFIEVLLAVVLCSLIAGNIYALMFQGIRLDSRTEVAAERHWMMYQAVHLMEKDLQAMVPYQDRDDEHINFLGEHNLIRGVVSTGQGLREIEYSLRPVGRDNIHKIIIGERSAYNRDIILKNETQQEIYELVRKETAFPFLNDKSADQQEQIVARGLTPEGLHFFYAAVSEDGNSREWRDEGKEDGIPQGIKIELNFLAAQDFRPITLSREVFLPAGIMFLSND